ncbi:MAG: phosphatidylglycerol lysyltransferase domain-containing protein [Eubacteriaceae bacterium]|nr:phosphatidylglycerol lysyltransferase domain-containing protein [Eubacteriaceae bacterium]
MFMFDGRITIEDKDTLEEYLDGYDYQTSGLSFSALYMWRDINKFSWRKIGDYMCLSGISHLELEEGIILPFMFPPLTRDGKYDPESLRETIYEAREIFEKAGYEFSMRLVPLHMIDDLKAACPGELKVIEDRPNYDYVYRTQDLIELKGRDYHGKKNHLNYFNKTYQYEYVPLTSAMAEDAMRFISDFNKRKDVPEHEMEMLKMEEEAMKDVFLNIETIGYEAGAILIDGNIEAIAIGGVLNKNTVTEHVEKANVNFRGLYQAINNEFCRHVAYRAKYINREEDMGIPNLRKAKLSYRPCKLIEKHIIKFK